MDWSTPRSRRKHSVCMCVCVCVILARTPIYRIAHKFRGFLIWQIGGFGKDCQFKSAKLFHPMYLKRGRRLYRQY